MALAKNETEEQFFDEEKEFWDRESERSAKRIKNIRKDDFLRELAGREMWWHKYTKPLKNKLILDVGCGTEDDFIPYFLISGNKVVGTDLSESAIKVNKMLLDRLGIGSEIVDSGKIRDVSKVFSSKKSLKALLSVCNAETLPFRKGQFDAVHAKWVLHHTRSIPNALRSINRALKPGGMFICTESNVLYPLRWITQTRILRPINPFRYLAIKYGPLDPNELARTPWTYFRMMRKAGFRIRAVDYKHGFECASYVTRLFVKNQRVINFTKKVDNALLHLEFPKYFSMDIKILAEKVRDV